MVTFELVEKSGEMLRYEYYPEDDHSAAPGIIVVDLTRMAVDMRKPAEKDVFRPASDEEKAAMQAGLNAMRKKRGDPPLPKEILDSMTRAAGKYVYLDPAMQMIANAFYSGSPLEKGRAD